MASLYFIYRINFNGVFDPGRFDEPSELRWAKIAGHGDGLELARYLDEHYDANWVILAFDDVVAALISGVFDIYVTEDASFLNMLPSGEFGSIPAPFSILSDIDGTSEPDNLLGSEHAENISAGQGDDTVTAGGGNDRMEGGAGNDRLNGGSGDDTAIYTGNREDYVVFIAPNGDAIVLDGNAARDGRDTLSNVEHLQFAGQTVTTAQAVMPVADADNSAYEVYRFFNTLTGTHFFTTSLDERNLLISSNPALSYDGNSFDSNATADNGGSAVYRFFNTQTGMHFYTADAGEADNIRSNLPQFNDEGIVYYAHTSADAGGSALYRFYNTENGSHFFTPSEAERDTIIGTLGHFNYEGIAYYVDGA
jgi:hypothetical protein